MLVIVDYGMGNLFSIQRACEKVGIDAEISNDPADIWRASGIILPGVGAFPHAMDRLRPYLADTIKNYAESRLVIGICLGMQLMMERSEENGGADGLGFFEGTCTQLHGGRVPSVGWRKLTAHQSWDGTPLEGMEPTPFYFSHSYGVAGASCVGEGPEEYAHARHDHDEVSEHWIYRAMIGNGSNIWGMQFHPEKSGPAGLKVFENIKRMMRQ